MRMNRYARSLANALTSATIALFVATTGWSQTLTWLGTLPGNRSSEAWGVSADGRVVVGTYVDGNGNYNAFRWSRETGMENLANPTLRGRAFAVSANGEVVVGEYYTSSGLRRAFRWTRSAGLEDLGTLEGHSCAFAFDVSADGSVIVGTSLPECDLSYARAVRWIGGTIENLGTIPNGVNSSAVGVSPDGTVVVGGSVLAFGNVMPARWTRETGMVRLGSERGYVYEVSADGWILVGWVGLEPERAVRWNRGVKEYLGVLRDGAWNYAFAVSADGSVVVGSERYQNELTAFRWTPSRGMEDLNTTYADLLRDGSRLMAAYDISLDGRYIVGYGYNAATRRNEAFLLDTRCTSHNGDVDNNRCVDDADLLAVLFAFGSTGSNLGRVDVNCDQTVDDADLLQVLFNFGSGC